MLLAKLPLLTKFVLLKNTKVNNDVFFYLKNCNNLKHLEIGGMPTDFNNNLTFEGIENLTLLRSNLRVLRFEYCAKIGDLSIQLINKRFGENLEEFSVVRNYFDKVSKISDDCLKSFATCPKLRKLELVYSRKFDLNVATYLAKYFSNLRVLNLSGCPM